MAVYYYTARTGEGAALAGSLDAATRDEAVGHLRSRSLFVTSVETGETTRGILVQIALYAGRGAHRRAAFFRSFATLVGAGVPLRRALSTVLVECRDRIFGETIRSVIADVDRGVALSTAASRHSREFSRVALAMIRAGEACGALDAALFQIAELEERESALRKRVGAALAYPAVVTAAAAALIAFLLANTMPAFAAMFEQMHVDLPPTTRALIAAGALLRMPAAWACAAAIVASVIAGGRYLRRSERAPSLWFARAMLATPVVGAIVAKSEVARFARTLGTLLRGGVDVIAALESARDVMESLVYKRGSSGIAEALHRGDSLYEALAGTELFDATFLQLVRAGEESGSLDAMLVRLAEYNEIDVETSLATIGSILEPALICILGGIIGTIVASVIVPLYSMIGSIR
ncbi:MAG TPA: type II secretion system F family protein [Candidatus Acidoferrales bacterium]|jgi:type II secretory pathway component PulF|nr:type II secretion system F family protein [Candidatus Acidoferrales bacterium]